MLQQIRLLDQANASVGASPKVAAGAGARVPADDVSDGDLVLAGDGGAGLA